MVLTTRVNADLVVVDVVHYRSAMTSARQAVATFWDEHIKAWLAGGDPMPQPLPQWFDAFKGKGLGKVTRDGFPEPYIGDLLGVTTIPQVVVLGLNPGEYHPDFQARDGRFAAEIQQCGSYSAWAATGPYLRAPWTAAKGRNGYWVDRVTFAGRWLGKPTATHHNLLVFEFYPWHSKKITAAMKPAPEIIDQFVLRPIAELPVPDVFAFGKPWNHLAHAMGLRCLDKLGQGGSPYGSQVPSRAVRTYALPSGQRLVVEWHSGSFGPPSESETAILRKVLN